MRDDKLAYSTWRIPDDVGAVLEFLASRERPGSGSQLANVGDSNPSDARIGAEFGKALSVVLHRLQPLASRAELLPACLARLGLLSFVAAKRALLEEEMAALHLLARGCIPGIVDEALAVSREEERLHYPSSLKKGPRFALWHLNLQHLPDSPVGVKARRVSKNGVLEAGRVAGVGFVARPARLECAAVIDECQIFISCTVDLQNMQELFELLSIRVGVLRCPPSVPIQVKLRIFRRRARCSTASLGRSAEMKGLFGKIISTMPGQLAPALCIPLSQPANLHPSDA
eukprot:2371139-Prymnesium_polylepis.1